MENSIIITSLKFRQRMGSIHYLTLTGNYGPLEISLGYSNQTDKGSCFVNLGYYF